MSAVFADTFYFLALWNPHDLGHAKALDFTNSYREAYATTDWIVTELADALACPPNRQRFLRLFRVLQQQKEMAIIPASRETLDEGLGLYERSFDGRPSFRASWVRCTAQVKDIEVKRMVSRLLANMRSGFLLIA